MRASGIRDSDSALSQEISSSILALPANRENIFLRCRRDHAVPKSAELAYCLQPFRKKDGALRGCRIESLWRVGFPITMIVRGLSLRKTLQLPIYDGRDAPEAVEKEGVCSLARALLLVRRAWRLKAISAFWDHYPMTKTGSTWIRCAAPAAAVDPCVVRGRAPPSAAGARAGLRSGVPVHRLPRAVQE